MRLDLDIIKLKHQLNYFRKLYPTTYKIKKEYDLLMNKIIILLQNQEKIDYKSFNTTLMNEPEIKKFYEETELANINKEFIFKKLNLKEKNFLEEKKYDIKLDKYNLFSMKKSPNNKFVEEWNQIQKDKHNASLNEYYKDRDWKEL